MKKEVAFHNLLEICVPPLRTLNGTELRKTRDLTLKSWSSLGGTLRADYLQLYTFSLDNLIHTLNFFFF